MTGRNRRFGPGNRWLGFGVVEVLVVVPAVTLCLAVAVPALQQAKQNARKAVCTSNVRNMGLAVLQYHFEYDGWLPMAYAGGRKKGKRTYATEVSPYLGIEDNKWLSGPYWKPDAPAILCCPSETKQYGNHILGYGWNWRYLGGYYETGWSCRRKVDEVKRPHETSCLGESRPVGGDLKTTLWWGGRHRKGGPKVDENERKDDKKDDAKDTRDGKAEYYMGKRHDGGANYLCVDSHVEYATYDDLVKDWLGTKRVFSRGE